MIGWTDLPADLSDSAALRRLSAHLPKHAPVISSDLTRAITTAGLVLRHARKGLCCATHDRARECLDVGFEDAALQTTTLDLSQRHAQLACELSHRRRRVGQSHRRGGGVVRRHGGSRCSGHCCY